MNLIKHAFIFIEKLISMLRLRKKKPINSEFDGLSLIKINNYN